MRTRNKKQRRIGPANPFWVALPLILFDILLFYIAYTDYNYPCVPAVDRYIATIMFVVAFIIFAVIIVLAIYAISWTLGYKGKYLSCKKANHKPKNTLSDEGAKCIDEGTELIEETRAILEELRNLGEED